MQYDRSLLTLDIDGAQPRPINAYMNRLLPNQLSFQEQIQLQRQIPHQDFQFGRRRYQHDFHHLCNLCVPQGEEYFNKSNKKHYEQQKGEINQFKVLENYYDIPKYQIVFDKGNQSLTDYYVQRILMVQFLEVYRVKQFEIKSQPKSQDQKGRNNRESIIILCQIIIEGRKDIKIPEDKDHIQFKQTLIQL